MVLHDPLTGLPGHALLLDRLEQSLIRARTRGTLVTLVLITAPDSLLDAAHVLRAGLRPDFTVARYRDTVLAVLAEHDIASWVAGEVAAAESGSGAGTVDLVGSHA